MKHLFAAAGILMASVAWANPATQASQGDAAQAQPLATGQCAACHGADGNSASPTFPSLAGLFPEYVVKQLKDFKSGARNNALMAGQVATLSAQDMLNLGAYYAAQRPNPGTAKDPSVMAAGQKLYKGGNMGSGVPACASCHGPTGAGIPVQFPRLAGQHSDYVLAQLRSFRTGERSNDGGKMMQVIARKMTEQEMKAVAEYVTGLR